jgi:hypothetical protein
MSFKTTLSVGLVLIISSLVYAQNDAASGDFVRLIAPLDEPEFYCLDLAGWGDHVQLDDPLQTHTCKIRGGGDQMFFFEDNRLKVAGFDRCVQIAGSSGVTLMGSSVLARACSDNALQELSIDEEGYIHIGDTDYCLGTGSESAEAAGPSHMWRTLIAVHCGTTPAEMVTWQVGLE